ncbi:PEP-CTERM sorting domain-containing protein [Planctomycetes bacterium K23_9]|uniref:Ice-binding protein C-terminal domain-containing protein n=1 Tax=Stieleria marina TaxID=1930275 RepID=A0A517NNX0_9BACT|nr:hypothetical protein K239x_07610 [Planctomycetes bacterium K23_9]
MKPRILSLVAVLATALPVMSAPTRYLESGAFDTAATGLPFTTVNFDTVGADAIISDGTVFDGLKFDYGAGLGTDELIVVYKPDSANDYDTTSGDAYLGGDVDELIRDNSSFTISNPTGFNAFSFQIVAPEALFLGDIEISVPGNPVFDFTDATFSNELPNGAGFRYFFGIHDPTDSFDSVTINVPLIDDTTDLFGIDDIRFSAVTAVPEPGSLTFLAFGACLVSIRRRRRR